MNLICGETCPVMVAKNHVLDVTAGINEHPYGVYPGLPTIEDGIDKHLDMMSFDSALSEQSCERSCRVIRAMLYSTSVGGAGMHLIKLLPELGQEI